MLSLITTLKSMNSNFASNSSTFSRKIRKSINSSVINLLSSWDFKKSAKTSRPLAISSTRLFWKILSQVLRTIKNLTIHSHLSQMSQTSKENLWRYFQPKWVFSQPYSAGTRFKLFCKCILLIRRFKISSISCLYLSSHSTSPTKKNGSWWKTRSKGTCLSTRKMSASYWKLQKKKIRQKIKCQASNKRRTSD